MRDTKLHHKGHSDVLVMSVKIVFSSCISKLAMRGSTATFISCPHWTESLLFNSCSGCISAISKLWEQCTRTFTTRPHSEWMVSLRAKIAQIQILWIFYVQSRTVCSLHGRVVFYSMFSKHEPLFMSIGDSKIVSGFKHGSKYCVCPGI